MICLNLDLCFHLWGSQQFEVMPGAKKPVEYFLQREMTGTGLTEDELFEYREDEYPQIRGGTVSLIPREDKERVLDLLQECLRFRIELGALVSYVRGDGFVRARNSQGDDFLYISVQPNEHLGTSPIAILLQKLAKYVESKYAIDLKPADLCLEIPSGEQIPNGYTLLDLVFVAATSPERRNNWADTYKILRLTLEYVPRLTPLSVTGQNLL